MNVTLNTTAAAIGVSGFGPIVDLAATAEVPDPNNLSVILVVTAVGGGTPSLTVEVVWSNDGATFVSAATADTFTAITANGNVQKSFTVKARYTRLKYTVTGSTPTFTLDASGYAA